MPDDPFIENMDEYTWVWMYQNWAQDQEDMHKNYKDYALFLGSFQNANLAKEIAKRDDPDFESSEEEMEESTEVVRQAREIAKKRSAVTEFKHRRRRIQK